jgi:transglutaminase-like putative cysteine protease
MRRLKILHSTRYTYAQPVKLLTHKLMLRPREGHDIRIESSQLRINPSHRISWHRDVNGNSVAIVEFEEEASFLEFDSEVVIEHYEDAPVELFLDPRAEHFPFQYDAGERAVLAPYQHPLFMQQISAVRDWVDGFWKPGQTQPTFSLLEQMNRAIPNQLAYWRREEVGVQHPAETLAKGGGSCRDFATLFMESCRHLGLAARFVSGYRHEPNLPSGQGATHAWCEVYLTGAGWRGFDSTIGECAGSDHIAVAVARHPESIPPVSGSYFGQSYSTMDVRVDVVQLDRSQGQSAT